MSLHGYYVGEIEYHMLQFLVKQVVPNFVMLDVGAHHGVFTLVAAQELKNRHWRGVVHSFEPNPQNFALLEHNVRENGFQEFTVLHPEAVADAEGQNILKINPAENSDNVLADENGVQPGALDVTVNVISLDSLLTTLPHVNVLKIDVQGREPGVLVGAEKLIARDRPVIIVEAVAGWPSTRQIEAFLKEHNYLIYGVDRNGELCRPNSHEAYVSWDWVGMPK